MKFTHYFFLSYGLVFGFGLCAQELTQIQKGEPTPLVGITGVNHEDAKESEPNASQAGGMEMERYFGTYVYDALRLCSAEVHRVGSAWVKAHDLAISKDVKSDFSISILAWVPDYQGMFEFKYNVRSDQTYARISLDYYSKNGKHLSPETIPGFLKTYEINRLWSDLEEAMACIPTATQSK